MRYRASERLKLSRRRTPWLVLPAALVLVACDRDDTRATMAERSPDSVSQVWSTPNDAPKPIRTMVVGRLERLPEEDLLAGRYDWLMDPAFGTGASPLDQNVIQIGLLGPFRRRLETEGLGNGDFNHVSDLTPPSTNPIFLFVHLSAPTGHAYRIDLTVRTRLGTATYSRTRSMDEIWIDRTETWMGPRQRINVSARRDIADLSAQICQVLAGSTCLTSFN